MSTCDYATTTEYLPEVEANFRLQVSRRWKKDPSSFEKYTQVFDDNMDSSTT
jgi:hypothetical protein